MRAIPKYHTLYKNELIRWVEYCRAKNYPESYMKPMLDIWRENAKPGQHHWQSYRDALREIDK